MARCLHTPRGIAQYEDIDAILPRVDPRLRSATRKILMVYASACIRNDAGRVLWQRRADFGWWGLSGGVLELNESLPECVIREVREETGLSVRADPFDRGIFFAGL